MQEGVGGLAGRLRRQTYSTIPCYYSDQPCWRSKNLPEERGPLARRRSQDQQYAWPSSPCKEDGKAKDHCRNRGGTTWGCYSHGVRSFRITCGGLHGKRGHGPAEVERVPDEDARCQSAPSRVRVQDFEGCDQ